MPKCAYCDEPMSPRSGKRFCSDPCRYAAWVKVQPKRYDRQDFINRIRASSAWPNHISRDIVIEWIEDNLE